MFSYLLYGTYQSRLEILNFIFIFIIHNFYFTFPGCTEYLNRQFYNLGSIVYHTVLGKFKREEESTSRTEYVYSTPVKNNKANNLTNNDYKLGNSYIDNSTKPNSAITSTSGTYKPFEKTIDYSSSKKSPVVNLYNTQYITYGTPEVKTETFVSDYEKIISRSYSKTGPLKNDGTPDMRYNENRVNNPGGLTNTMFGDRDLRYSVNQQMPKGPLKKDGTPDMRYSVNKNKSYY